MHPKTHLPQSLALFLDSRALALHSRGLVLTPALLLLLGHGLQLGERLGDWRETIRSPARPNGIYHLYTCHPTPCSRHIRTAEPPPPHQTSALRCSRLSARAALSCSFFCRLRSSYLSSRILALCELETELCWGRPCHGHNNNDDGIRTWRLGEVSSAGSSTRAAATRASRDREPLLSLPMGARRPRRPPRWPPWAGLGPLLRNGESPLSGCGKAGDGRASNLHENVVRGCALNCIASVRLIAARHCISRMAPPSRWRARASASRVFGQVGPIIQHCSSG